MSPEQDSKRLLRQRVYDIWQGAMGGYNWQSYASTIEDFCEHYNLYDGSGRFEQAVRIVFDDPSFCGYGSTVNQVTRYLWDKGIRL